MIFGFFIICVCALGHFFLFFLSWRGMMRTLPALPLLSPLQGHGKQGEPRVRLRRVFRFVHYWFTYAESDKGRGALLLTLRRKNAPEKFGARGEGRKSSWSNVFKFLYRVSFLDFLNNNFCIIKTNFERRIQVLIHWRWKYCF